jgi:transcriptional regulator with XRE-family HTH domain
MLGDKIRQARKANFLSQSELARRSGHPVSTIHGIENGDNQNPGFFTMGDIARELGISLDQLYLDCKKHKK